MTWKTSATSFLLSQPVEVCNFGGRPELFFGSGQSTPLINRLNESRVESVLESRSQAYLGLQTLEAHRGQEEGVVLEKQLEHADSGCYNFFFIERFDEWNPSKVLHHSSKSIEGSASKFKIPGTFCVQCFKIR